MEPFTVKDIRLEGIQRVEAGTVFSYLPVKVGETMTDDKAAQAIKTLFATGFFKDVRIEIDGEVVIVVVEERPAIAQIDFVGLKEFDKDQLIKGLKEVGVAVSRTFDRATLEKAEQELKRQYLSRGRYAATITTTITPLERNRVAINFNVDEGETARSSRSTSSVSRPSGKRTCWPCCSRRRPTGSAGIPRATSIRSRSCRRTSKRCVPTTSIAATWSSASSRRRSRSRPTRRKSTSRSASTRASVISFRR
jgi:outer membrane translocation and assembly module TamA